MKRCIICGNTGDETSTVCSVCGGSFADAEDNMSGTQDMAMISKQLEEMLLHTEEEDQNADIQLQNLFGEDAKTSVTEISLEKADAPVQDEAVRENKEEPVAEAEKEAVPAGNRQPRRMKSEPQIYGQSQMGDMAAYNGQQGMVRRNMQGRPAPQGQPVNAAPQRRPAQGQPVNAAAQGRPMQGQPVNAAAQGRPMQGQPVNAAAQGRPAPQGQPVNAAAQGRPMQGQPANAAVQGRFAKNVMETARKSIKSFLFFLIVLLNTVSLAGSVAAVFMKDLNYTLFARLITDIELPSQVAGYMDEFKNIMVTLDTNAMGVNLAMLIPNMLFCLGLWLVLFCALGAKERMNTVGFSCMKIVVLFHMIISCIGVLAGLIVAVTLVVAAWASGTQTMIIGAIVAMVVMIVVAMAVIMYYFCYLATIKTIRFSAKSGETFGSASAYVALIHIIGSLGSIINLLAGIVNAEITNIAAAGGQIAWMVLFGLWILSYRRKMKKIAEA